MNKVVLVGRLTKDPELKFGQGSGTAVCNFTIAVNRRFKREGQPEADFIPVVCFGKAAEATANYMTKGKLVSVAGVIQTRNYEAKDGTKKYITEVVADEVNFLEKKEDASTNENKTTSYDIDGATLIDDGDIPF